MKFGPRRRKKKNSFDFLRERDLDKAREMARIRERVKGIERKSAPAVSYTATKPAFEKENEAPSRRESNQRKSRSFRFVCMMNFI